MIVVASFLLAFARASNWPHPTVRDLFAIFDVPVAKGITEAAGIAGSVAPHPEACETLLAFSCGVISGCSSAAMLRRYMGSADRG